MRRLTIPFILLLALTGPLILADRRPGEENLAGFKTVETAVTVKAAELKASSATAGQAGYLGVLLEADRRGRPTVSEVHPASPADRCGIQPGDQIRKLNGQEPRSVEALRDALRLLSPGDRVRIELERDRKRLEMEVELGALSRPKSLDGPRASLGIFLGEPGDEGAPITRVVPSSPADRAGLRSGDIVAQIDGAPVTGALRLADVVSERKPGDVMTLGIKRDGRASEIRVTLGEDTSLQDRQPESVARTLWKKEVFRLGVVCIEYPDVEHNSQVKTSDWEEALFSKGTYSGRESVTGQPVFGSLNDYYQEVSCGALRVEGKVFDWVRVSKNRGDYSQGTGTGIRNRTEVLTEALAEVAKRDGDSALDGFDGLFFLYAGSRFQTSRGGIYWPHRSTVSYRGRRWGYFIVPEGGPRMTNISVICHEFGHMLGLPDLYARPENPGSEGLGIWCAMSNQAGNGRPQHMGAWCKEQLGWLKPAVIDPTVKQKLILAPIEGSAKECFKVLLRPDGSEYLLLENRKKTGFDQSLPAEGLLIWRVVGRRPMLEESHGVPGPPGPGVFLSSVPYPSGSNDAFTPYTTPSSRAQLAGGLPVHITNIRRLADGRVTFYIGYEFD